MVSKANAYAVPTSIGRHAMLSRQRKKRGPLRHHAQRSPERSCSNSRQQSSASKCDRILRLPFPLAPWHSRIWPASAPPTVRDVRRCASRHPSDVPIFLFHFALQLMPVTLDLIPVHGTTPCLWWFAPPQPNCKVRATCSRPLSGESHEKKWALRHKICQCMNLLRRFSGYGKAEWLFCDRRDVPPIECRK